MAKNEKNGVSQARWRRFAWVGAAGVVIGITGLGLVQQRNQQHQLAKESIALGREIGVLEEKIRQATKVEAMMRSPTVLEQRVREMQLGLVPIQATQRLYLARGVVTGALQPVASVSTGTWRHGVDTNVISGTTKNRDDREHRAGAVAIAR